MTPAYNQDRPVRRVLIIHNYPTPYRLPLFARLATLWEVEISVLFTRQSSAQMGD